MWRARARTLGAYIRDFAGAMKNRGYVTLGTSDGIASARANMVWPGSGPLGIRCWSSESNLGSILRRATDRPDCLTMRS